jgi:hypothetical protein
MTMDPATLGLASQQLIECGFAAGLAASLWRRHWGYAAFLVLALVESHQSLRYPFHVWVRDALLGPPPGNGYKHIVQSDLLYVGGMLGLAVLVVLTPLLLRASTGRRLMIGGTAIVIGMLAIELISAHWIDVVIYHPQGPFTRAAIVYFVGAATIACGALLTPHRPQPAGIIRGASRRDA